MTRYLLDTTALIDISKGREPASSRFRAMLASSDEIGVCAVNIAEFYSGIVAAERDNWNTFFDRLTLWHISRTVAIRAGIYRYDFGFQGRTLSTTDALVAAVVHEYDSVLVTENVRDYPMTDITVRPMESA